MRTPSRRVVRLALLVVAAFAIVSLLRADIPVDAYRRQIVVDVPRDVAWAHFANVRRWSTWMPALTSVDITPDDTVGPSTVATLHMDSMTTTFTMAEFDPPRHWMWTGKVGWFTMLYDHVFEAVDARRTRITFHMRVTGFGKHLFGILLAVTSRPSHDDWFPRLVTEMNALEK